jgi:multiple sugar transport system substrate-binding protein
MPSPHLPVSAGTSRRSLLRRGASLALLAPAQAALGAPRASAATTRSGTSPDFEGVTLKVLCNIPHAPMYNDFLAPAWQQLTGGILQATSVDYADLGNAIIQDVSSGTGTYDCFDYYYYLLGSIAQAGALLDLTAWIETHNDLRTPDFLQSIYDPYTLYQGRRYGLPYDGDQQLVFYNRELFDAYGLTPPTTWNEYDAAARTITEGGAGAHYGVAIAGQPDPIVLGCAFINRLVGSGGDLVDRHGRPTLTSDAALAAARHLIDIAPYALPTPTTTGLGTATAAFLSGEVALFENWVDLAQRAADPALSKVVGKWGVVAFPLGTGNTRRRTPLDGGYGLGVSAASKNPRAALAFISWATGSAEMLAQGTQKDSNISPNRTSVLTNPAYAANTPIAYDLIRAGLEGTPMVWPHGAADPANLQNLVNELALAIEGTQSATTALRNAQNAWVS